MSTLPPSPAIAPATLPHLWRARWSWGYAAATLGLTIVLVWTVANLTDIRALAATLGALLLRTDLMAIFLVSYTGAFALRAIAWRALLAQPVPTGRLFVILQIALLANHLFPTKVGEVIRIGLLTRAGAPVAAATASTLMARLLDFGALCGIALCLTPLATGNASNVATRLVIPLSCIIACTIGLRLLSTGVVAGVLTRLPQRLAEFGLALQSSLKAVSARRVITALAFVLPSWLLEAGVVWVAAQAAAQPLSLEAAVAATAITICFQAFQITPGGLGIYEASMTGALMLFGIEPGAGLSLAITTHALKFGYSYVAGFLALLAEGSVGVRPGINLRPALARVAEWAAVLWWLLVLAVAIPVLAPRLWWRGRRPLTPPAPVTAGDLLAVIIPVHNEAGAIGTVVTGVPRARLRELGLTPQVIVVDDGSTDNSAVEAYQAGADKIVTHHTRQGLGAALRSGLAAARESGAAATVYLDGDGEYDPADIPAVAAPVLRGEADYVLGVRFPSAAAIMQPSRQRGNRCFTWLMRLLTGKRLDDAQSGFRAFSARAVAGAEIVHDYNYAQVLTLNLLAKQMRMAQTPIRYRVRGRGQSFIRYAEYLRRVVPAMVHEMARA